MGITPLELDLDPFLRIIILARGHQIAASLRPDCKMIASDHTFASYRKPLDTGVSINGLVACIGGVSSYDTP